VSRLLLTRTAGAAIISPIPIPDANRSPQAVEAKAAWEAAHRVKRSASRKARRLANPYHFWAEKCIHGNRAVGDAIQGVIRV
jgi:hypothetical protein